jgi:hypothetical protein
MGVGAWLTTIVITWTLSVGTTLPVVSAAVLVGVSCLILGSAHSHLLRRLGPWQHATTSIFFAGWIVLARDLPELGSWFFTLWPLEILSSEGVAFAVTLPVAALVLGPPLFAVGAWLSSDCESYQPLRHRRLLGIGLGLILAPQTVHLWIGPRIVLNGIVAACLLRVIFELVLHTERGQRLRAAVLLWWQTRFARSKTLVSPVLFAPSRKFIANPLERLASESSSRRIEPLPLSGEKQWLWFGAACASLVGGSLALLERIWTQLFLTQIQWSLTLLGCLCIGNCLGDALASRRSRRFKSLPTRASDLLIAASGIAWVLFGFAWWVGGLLQLNTYCESPWLMFAARTAIVAAMALPPACMLGVIGHRPDAQVPNERSGSGPFDWIWGAAGYLCIRWLSPDPDVAGLIVVTGLIVLGIVFAVRVELRAWKSVAKWWSVPVGLTCTLVLLSSYSSADSSRLLFSTQVFLAARAGEPSEQLLQLDATRLISTREGRESTWTIWNQQGYRISIRRDGMPFGAFSRDLAICPHSTNEIAPTILPLVLHAEPRSLMLLGTVTPASLSACTAFPLERITCVLRDPDALALQSELASLSMQKDPFLDDRVECHALDPVLGMRASQREPLDVIICREEFSATPGDGGTFTVEFYRHVSRHLAPNGVFAQQVDLADFGAIPLQSMLTSLRCAFHSVAFVHTSPDKGLLLASPTERDWLTEDIARRAEAPHVRRLCSQVGWDWSVLLSLTATSPEAVTRLCAGGRPLTSADGGFLCSFPAEVLRWAPKSHEMYRFLEPCSTSLISWLGAESTAVADVSRRLADMTLQRQTIQDHPDYYWAYRRSLRDRLQKEPRSQIVQASGGGLRQGLHPEDQRRKEYFRVLADAATQSNPSPAEIEALEDFLEPYDPMVSYFVHQEIANLYSRAATPLLREEFEHLLHSVFYGPGNDRSVRNLVESLELLIENPTLIENPRDRFDCFNGLMELLKYRWQLRIQSVEAASRFGPVDATLSLQVGERALLAMGDLRSATNLSEEEWRARRRVLQVHFIHDVETYRDQLARRVGRNLAVTPPAAPTDADLQELQDAAEPDAADLEAAGPIETVSGPPEESVQ